MFPDGIWVSLDEKDYLHVMKNLPRVSILLLQNPAAKVQESKKLPKTTN